MVARIIVYSDARYMCILSKWKSKHKERTMATACWKNPPKADSVGEPRVIGDKFSIHWNTLFDGLSEQLNGGTQGNPLILELEILGSRFESNRRVNALADTHALASGASLQRWWICALTSGLELRREAYRDRWNGVQQIQCYNVVGEEWSGKLIFPWEEDTMLQVHVKQTNQQDERNRDLFVVTIYKESRQKESSEESMSGDPICDSPSSNSRHPDNTRATRSAGSSSVLSSGLP